MPAPASTATTAPAKAPAKAANAAPPPSPYPFPVGVYESTIGDYDQTLNFASVTAWGGAGTTDLQPWKISPTGWIRACWLDITCTIAGNSATPTFAEDGPFSAINKIVLNDLGSEQVVSLTGYEWMLTNKYGGYYDVGDPRKDITYSVTTGSGGSAGSFHFTMAVPFEAVARDGLGTSQNESKPGWQITLTIDTSAKTYGTTPTAAATASFRVKGYPESYTEPSTSGANGRPFAQTPPLPGTLQYWKSESDPLGAGQQQYDLTNGIGFPIRNIIYYARSTADGTRATADANWPDPSTLLLGNINLYTRSKNLWISRMGKDFGFNSTTPDTAGGRDNAVFPIYRTLDFGLRPGAELRFKYYDTLVNSLIRFSGQWGAGVTFYALVNWLATPSKNRYALIGGNS